jgi:hypothetical protein
MVSYKFQVLKKCPAKFLTLVFCPIAGEVFECAFVEMNRKWKNKKYAKNVA